MSNVMRKIALLPYKWVVRFLHTRSRQLRRTEKTYCTVGEPLAGYRFPIFGLVLLAFGPSAFGPLRSADLYSKQVNTVGTTFGFWILAFGTEPGSCVLCGVGLQQLSQGQQPL